ncbi:acyltransferase [Synechococcus sp. CS-1325]|uniref:acyltransferase family protein n=1 Tax=Synechococcus sp. CS-1325 TaxID=2847979 RepID=UPI00223AFB3E|nr:acyltransferase [Synechococcus sp. CS-1325]MCT0198184.1 acyltransferase [Synechococcus sp. CS-1325]
MSLGSDQGSAQARLRSLDWIRGFAALSVVLYHAEIGSHAHLLPLVAPTWSTPLWFGAGWMGVPVFFTLSGDVIARTLNARPQSVRRFLARRFWRIYPTYLALTLLFITLLLILPRGVAQTASLSPAKTLNSLLFGWGQIDGSYLYVAWTLFWEVSFYLLAAPFAPGLGRLPLNLSLLAFPLITMLALVVPLEAAHRPLTYLACFLAGVSAFALPPILRGGQSQRMLWGMGLGGYGLGLTLLAINPHGYARGFGVAAAASSLLLLFGVALERRRPDLFIHPLPLWLGKISYSLYLVQVLTVPAVMKGLAMLLDSAPGAAQIPFALLNGLAIAITLVVSLVGAWLSWRLLEVKLSQWLQECWT